MANKIATVLRLQAIILIAAQIESQIDHYVLNFKFNKVMSGFMEFYNKNKSKVVDTMTANRITEILRCFAPGF